MNPCGPLDIVDNNLSILTDIRGIHKEFPLSGNPRNTLLNVSDDLLLYIISLLRNEKPKCPNLPLSKWYELLIALDSHWISPLIYWKIAHLEPNLKPPTDIVNALRLKFFENRIRSHIVYKQIQKISDAFNKSNIPFIVLKGSAIARTVYSDPALRAGSDIDLLVSPNNMRLARETMEKLGYICIKKNYDIQKYWYHEEEFIYKNGHNNYLQVEFHWEINTFPMLPHVDINQLFNRSITVTSSGVSFKALCPVDNLIYSSMHLCLKHNNDIRLSWIYDIFLLCGSLNKDDWAMLQKMSVDYGARLSIENSLKMAQSWTWLQIPYEYYDFTKWPKPLKNEFTAFSYATQGRNNTFKRFKLRWPRSAPFSEKVKNLVLYDIPSH